MMSLPQTYKALIAYGKGTKPKIEDKPLPKPDKNQVLVKVEYAPINPSDLMAMAGVYRLPVNPPHGVGLEGSGIVAAVGDDLQVPHNLGDKVHITGLGTYAQYIMVNSSDLRKVQPNVTSEEAACHIINPGAVACMGHLAKKGGHKAVIHTAGTSALGRMLIKYFKLKGIKTINIVRREEAIEELKKEGADYVLNSKAEDFEEKLKEIAHKEGATLSLESICGELTEKVLNCQPDKSVCHVYGALSKGEVSKIGVQHFIFEGKTITGFWLTPYMESMEAEERKQLMEEVYSLLPTTFKSTIQEIFKLEDIEKAVAFYEKNSSKGKILIQPN